MGIRMRGRELETQCAVESSLCWLLATTRGLGSWSGGRNGCFGGRSGNGRGNRRDRSRRGLRLGRLRIATRLVLNQLKVVLNGQIQQVQRDGHPNTVGDSDVEPKVGEVTDIQVGTSNDPFWEKMRKKMECGVRGIEETGKKDSKG